MLDALIVTALKEEFEAARTALDNAGAKLELRDDRSSPHLTGTLPKLDGTGSFRIALARPTRMGSPATSTIASSLVERLQPGCIAMCGVCAGNPSDVALGDVIIAEIAYFYDEGKRKKESFEGDHRQIPLEEGWLRVAQDLSLDGLSTFGMATHSDACAWLLDQIHLGLNPAIHPARDRYLPEEQLSEALKFLETSGKIQRRRLKFFLTRKGRDAVEASHAYALASPKVLPYKIHVGPIASGNVVVKDGLTWDLLKTMGVRTVLGLEMEAAAIAQIAFRQGVKHWVVAKGVMDHADPNKNDRYKRFAARSSAEVLLRFLDKVLPEERNAEVKLDETSGRRGSVANTVGNVTGSNINIIQNFRQD
jgi:nucleoside phosphorylase